jgi:hypothetical protein
LKPSSLERRRWDFPSNSVGVQLYGRRVSQHLRVDPVLDVPAGTRVRPRGWIGERIALTEEHWLIPAPASNPGMVHMFRRPVDLKAPNGPQASVARRRRSFGEPFGSANRSAPRAVRLRGRTRLRFCDVGSDILRRRVREPGAEWSCMQGCSAGRPLRRRVGACFPLGSGFRACCLLGSGFQCSAPHSAPVSWCGLQHAPEPSAQTRR